MKTRLSTILSYIGAVILGVILGIGLVAGVSSCNRQKYKRASAEDTSNNYVLSLKTTSYYPTYKPTAVSGEYYIDNSAKLRLFMYEADSITFDNLTYHYIKLFVNEEWDNSSQQDKLVMWGIGFTNNSQWLPDNSDVYFVYEGRYNQVLQYHNNFYRVDNLRFVDGFNSDGTAIYQFIEYYDNAFLLYWFEQLSIYSQPNEYNFNADFNYNAFAQFSSTQDMANIVPRGKTPFVQNGSASTPPFNTYLYVGLFESGGYTYDTIIVSWHVATTDILFETNENTYIHSKTIDSVNPYIYAYSMRYYNSINYASVSVAQRVNTLNASGDTIVLYNMAWTNTDYQNLTIYNELSDYSRNILAMANNGTDYSGFSSTTSDVGLGSAFTLLASAFSAWIPIFNIQVIPGISLGLLIFLPLIAGIVILIVWIVKR